MKKHDRKPTEPRMVLRWLFSQRDRLLTCGISIAGAAFEVVTLPHWDVGHGSMERFSSARAALGASCGDRRRAACERVDAGGLHALGATRVRARHVVVC